MSKQNIEIYEYEEYSFYQGKWLPHYLNPWQNLDGSDAVAPDFIYTPSGWFWITNWRIDRPPGASSMGWEYATSKHRFNVKNRQKKYSRQYRDFVRRRKLCRTMIMKTRNDNGRERYPSKDFAEIARRVQKGLHGVRMVKNHIVDILKKSSDALESDEVIESIETIRNNIKQMKSVLDTTENHPELGPDQLARIRKLWNDVHKEEDFFSSDNLNKLVAKIEKGMRSKEAKSRSSPYNNYGVNRNYSDGSLGSGNSSNQNSYALAAALGLSSFNDVTRDSYGNGNANDFISNGNINGQGGYSSAAQLNGQRTAGAVKGRGKFQPINMGLVENMGNNSDGTYINSNTQEMLIERRLKAVDQAAVQEQIISERGASFDKVHKNLTEVHALYDELQQMVQAQQEDIVALADNADVTNKQANDAMDNIEKAIERDKSIGCIIV